MIASMMSKLLFVFVRIQQNGIDLYSQTDQNQGWGQSDSSKVVDIRIEYIGVIAATSTHQNESKGNKSQANKKEDIVLSLKDEFRSRFLNLLFFLAHGAKLIIKIVRS